MALPQLRRNPELANTAGYLLFLAGVVIGAIVFAVAARRAAKADRSATAES